MNITDNPLLLFAAIIVGVVAQQVLGLLKQRGKKTASTIARPVVLIYWLALGLVMLIGGAGQLSRGDLLAGISGVALGLGLMISGFGQTLERDRLRTIGVIAMSTGPVVSGVSFIQSGNALGGMIALALGLGILVSTLKGWPGGVGQMVIGAVILGSSVMLLIGALAMNTAQPDFATGAIGVAMLALGLWVIIGGGMTVIGSVRRPQQATSPASKGSAA